MVVVLAVPIVVVMVRRIVVLVVLVMVQWVMGTEYVGGLGPGSGSWSACTIYPLCSTAAALFF